MIFNIYTTMWTFSIAVFVWLIAMVAFESDYVYTLMFSLLAFLNGMLFGLILIKH